MVQYKCYELTEAMRTTLRHLSLLSNHRRKEPTMLNNQEIKVPVLIEDLGKQYPTQKSKTMTHYGIYKCSCGNNFKAICTDVNNGHTKSCGCVKYKHGIGSHRLYNIWRHMILRCTNEKSSSYYKYGGRGITVCMEWRNDVKAFYSWSIENGYGENLTIDRINNDGNYEPSNCRWTTKEVQARNTRVLSKNNTSGYRGVSFSKIYNKWYSRIMANSKHIFIGRYETALEAAIAYDKYEIGRASCRERV